MTTRTPADVLRATAHYFESDPDRWGTDWYVAPDTGCRCTMGGIAWAIDPSDRDGDPLRVHVALLDTARDAVSLLERYLTEEAGFCPPECDDEGRPTPVATLTEPLVGYWNDRPGRTVAEVIATLRGAATWGESTRRAAALDVAFTERGATVRSWICSICGADVDSADLTAHLDGHDGPVAR